MDHTRQFYIDGEWVDPAGSGTGDVINPATEEPIAQISMGSAADVDRAVQAARAAFPGFAATSRQERIQLLTRIAEGYKARYQDLASAVSREMGAPSTLAAEMQAGSGAGHLGQVIEVLKSYEFDVPMGTTVVTREPIGACGFITPWNVPINQIMCKVAPALATGCTMVLKPSEIAPLNALILAEIFHDAGVPAGVFNLVNGDGRTVGEAIAAHPDLDMVSFTGSTRAGIRVAKAAADSVKRVHQELGGKSAAVILPDADLEKAVQAEIGSCFINTGQTCAAHTRFLVPAARQDEVAELARQVAESWKVGTPGTEGTMLGPVVSQAQFDKVQRLIQAGIDEGATLVTGGPGRPEGYDRGYYVRPTVFADVSPEMSIAREEIFGPVLSIMPYQDEEEAVRTANSSEYGLSGAVHSGDLEHARRVARRLRTGMVHLNGAGLDFAAPFGGYKHSGNGREWGVFGFEEFLEVKAIMGYNEG
ncbi:MAG TPA: aldehyde dehydrogenase family protein [Gammaproteobacteria bacterium]|nr:aldehyde dehydrogenase family protein [Gammaproteobacteria bacterium]